MAEFHLASVPENILSHSSDQAGMQIEHTPSAALFIQGRTVVDLARIHCDDITRTGLDQTSTAHGFLRAPMDETDAEVFVSMTSEGASSISQHRFDTLRPAGQGLNEG
ncbi:hypothetical protein NS274_04605 [Pseudomonas oryzihabitans]|nr:hypothetical protein NS274_04605 [Pseudomonas psychrotolerans]KTT03817.1 hypothetical protein NS376_07565 [Pseudomonas psychrotolerans]KTT28340.1 hypothetical protein NS201_21075 [Pseudomonas psychrotolerans]KTT28847.1 hypothetical protein SB9_22805 [Pseudomonas psychrotolerans]KTT38063.1 hypothetical protein SB5_18865 [Pseudomonas psychrotolerans]